MARWSLSKTFTSVSAKEFRDAVTDMQHSMGQNCDSPITVSVKFYNALKRSISQIIPGVNEFLAQQNASKVFAEVSRPEDVTDDLWNRAVYVEAILIPADNSKAPAYAFGHIEAKGVKGKQMTFYCQPDQLGTPVEQASKKKYSGWRKGDGFTSNHSVTLG